MNIKYLFTNKYRIVGGTAALRISVPRNRNCAEDPDPQSNAYGIQPDPDSQNIYLICNFTRRFQHGGAHLLQPAQKTAIILAKKFAIFSNIAYDLAIAIIRYSRLY